MVNNLPGSDASARIGRYPVVRRVGAGAFATVWLARDTEFDVDVAIKVLGDNWSADDGIRDRFLTEATFLRRIRDPRVVHVYEIGTLDDDRPYFVMDYLDGGTLDDLRRTGLAPAEALRLAAEAARGVEVLHRHHLIHRDVTPGNLLLSRREGGPSVVVADLGVARAIATSSVGGMIVGTPAYMAPEQPGPEPIDHRVDVYALCAVAYALLTQTPPFAVETATDLLHRASDSVPPPVAERLGAPARLDELFRSGLATDPSRRPPSAAILAQSFEQLAEDLIGVPALAHRAVRASAPTERRRRAADAPPTGPFRPAPRVGPVRPIAPRVEAGAPVSPAPGPRNRSSTFYITMTVLAVVLFAIFLAVVVSVSG